MARAAPDGYTLLSVSSAHAAAAAIYPKLPYEMSELAPITQTGTSKYVLVAPPGGPKSLKELLDAARAKIDRITMLAAKYSVLPCVHIHSGAFLHNDGPMLYLLLRKESSTPSCG